jgi:ribosomal protein S18 acetylase RimI-like enzyme
MTMASEPADVTIRVAVRADIDAIQKVARLAWASTYRGIIPPEIQHQAITAWYSTDVLTTAIESPDSLFLVAERGNQILGFVNLHRRLPHTVHLARIYLLPNERRRRFGTRLLVEALARWSPYEIVIVQVEKENDQARRFYERRGFAPKSTSTFQMFGFDIPLVTYEKNLRPERGPTSS